MMLGMAAVALFQASTLQADQVVERGNNYPGVTIRGLRDGRLIYRRATGQEHAPWLTSVDQLVFDRSGPFVDLSEAELRRVDGELDRALQSYRRARRLAVDFWPELIDVRVAMALRDSGRIGDFVKAYVNVVGGRETGPAAAARLFPESIPAEMNRDLNEAILALNKAAASERQPARKFMYELLSFHLLSEVGDKRAVSMAPVLSSYAPGSNLRTESVYRIVASALRLWLTSGDMPAGRQALNNALADCPDNLLPEFLMLKGDVLLAAADAKPSGSKKSRQNQENDRKESLQRAAMAFMRIPIHMPSSPLAGRALLRSAIIMERLERPTKALLLLEEGLSSNRLDASLREEMEGMKARLTASQPGAG
ncbi:MAG: hypothetical protein ACPGXK_04765 [Phycisphaerae bacterium]